LQRDAGDQTQARGIPLIVHEVLRASGEPLEPTTRALMESRFGHDFSRVRVHTDAKAVESAQAVHAQAYTVGRDIVFSRGQYAPERPEGRRLLAHELAHTIQQASAQATTHVPPAGGLTVGSPADSLERAADQAAEHALAASPTRRAPTPHQAAPHIQRQAQPDTPGLTLRPPPLTARLIGSGTLDGFALNSATLTTTHKTRLTGLAISLKDLLRSYPGGSIQITGHTDATGEETFNATLGQQRADAVQQFLIDAGVPAEAMTAISAGESQLRVPTKKPEPRNRRVEVRFEPESRLRLVPSLELPTPTPPTAGPKSEYGGPPTPPPLPDISRLCAINPDLCRPPEKPELPPDFWKPLPPAPKGTEPKSLLDVVFQKIVDPVVDGATNWLPKGVQTKIRDLAHDAVEKGITTGLEEALKGSNLGAEEQKAILKAVEAAIKQKSAP
jgi:outer membrane protein OmpA-like peptidoglycan-associated protein